MYSKSSIFYLLLLILLIIFSIFKNSTETNSVEPQAKVQEGKPNKLKESSRHIGQVEFDKKPQEQTKEVIELKTPQRPRESKIELYSDPLTDNKSYEWLVNIRFPEPKEYHSSKDILIKRTLHLYPALLFKLIGLKDDTIFAILSYPNTDLEHLLESAPTGSYIFQHGRFYKNMNAKYFDKDSLFCVLKINYNPEGFQRDTRSTFIKIKEKIPLLTEYPGYKGVRIISHPKDFEDIRVIKSIDCLLPLNSNASYDFSNLQILHLAYSLGADIFN